MMNFNGIKNLYWETCHLPTQSSETKVIFNQTSFSYRIWSNNNHLITFSFSYKMSLARVNRISLPGAFIFVCKVALNLRSWSARFALGTGMSHAVRQRWSNVVSPGNLLETQILNSHRRPTNRALEWSSRWCWFGGNWRTTAPRTLKLLKVAVGYPSGLPLGGLHGNGETHP